MMIIFLLSWALSQDVVVNETSSTVTKPKPQKPPPLPKYELGLGFMYGKLPDYPGSDETTIRAFPIPYFVYRGDVVQAERGGVRTRFLKGAYYEYDFSFAGAFPTSSSNEAREGMNDLDWMFEVGPQLKLFLYRSRAQQWTLRLPVRGVFSSSSDGIRGRGYTFSPNLQVSFPQIPFKKNILSVSFSSTYATKNTQSYFYDVKPKYVTTERAEYQATEGMLGSNLDLTLVTAWDKVAVFVNAGFAFYGEAENKKSPLHVENRSQSLMLGFIWSMYQSKEQGFR